MDIITNGPKLDLKKLPTQNIRPNYPLSSNNNEIISIETTKLLNKLIIGYSTPDKGEKKRWAKKMAIKGRYWIWKILISLWTISTLRWNP